MNKNVMIYGKILDDKVDRSYIESKIKNDDKLFINFKNRKKIRPNILNQYWDRNPIQRSTKPHINGWNILKWKRFICVERSI